jgi:hypothetical protein
LQARWPHTDTAHRMSQDSTPAGNGSPKDGKKLEKTADDDDILELGILKPSPYARCIMCGTRPTRAWILQDFRPAAKFEYNGITDPTIGHTFALCEGHNLQAGMVFVKYARTFASWDL